MGQSTIKLSCNWTYTPKIPVVQSINIESQSVLASSPTLNYTEKEADPNLEVHTQMKEKSWEYTWK